MRFMLKKDSSALCGPLTVRTAQVKSYPMRANVQSPDKVREYDDKNRAERRMPYGSLWRTHDNERNSRFVHLAGDCELCRTVMLVKQINRGAGYPGFFIEHLR